MPEIMSRNVVAFDLDDTLYTEMDYVRSGYRTVAKAMAKATGADADELFRLILANRPLGFEAALDRIKGLPGEELFSIDSMVEMYRAHTPDIDLRPGARATLKALRDRGDILVLITDGSTRHQRAKIKALGLEEFFAPEAILISEETGGDKTTLVPWQLTEERFGAPGTRFTYVGDNLSKDFLLPNTRGWETVMLRDSSRTNVFPQFSPSWPAQYRPNKTIDCLTTLI